MSEEPKPYQTKSGFTNLHSWSLYTEGARMMLYRLREHCLCDEPKPKGYGKDKDRLIYQKAVLDLIMDSKENVDRFLSDDYDEIRFTDHERDKKGKLVKCRAYFAKRVTTSVEIKD